MTDLLQKEGTTVRYIGFILVLAFCSMLLAQPTQPTTRPPYHPLPRRARVVLSGPDITAQLKAVKPGTAHTDFVITQDTAFTGTLVFPPVVDCTLSGGGQLHVVYGTVNFIASYQYVGGHRLTIHLSPGSGSGLDLRSTDLEISGIAFVPDQAAPAFKYGKAAGVRLGKAKFHDCTLEAPCGDFIVAEGPFADGSEIYNVLTNSELGNRVIFGGGVQRLNIHDTIAEHKSWGEDLFRFTLSDAGRKPADIQIVHCNLSNPSPYDKADISTRECDRSLKKYCWFKDGWSREGQDGVASSSNRPTYIGCRFGPVTIAQGQYPLTQLQFIGATDAVVSGCEFQNNTLPGRVTGQAISVSQVSTTKSIDHCVQRSLDGTKPKSLVINSSSRPVIPTNCSIVMPVTQPSH